MPVNYSLKLTKQLPKFVLKAASITFLISTGILNNQQNILLCNTEINLTTIDFLGINQYVLILKMKFPLMPVSTNS